MCPADAFQDTAEQRELKHYHPTTHIMLCAYTRNYIPFLRQPAALSPNISLSERCNDTPFSLFLHRGILCTVVESQANEVCTQPTALEFEQLFVLVYRYRD